MKNNEKKRLRTAAFDCKTVLRERTSRGKGLVPDAIHGKAGQLTEAEAAQKMEA
jgi:hypothetical protein